MGNAQPINPSCIAINLESAIETEYREALGITEIVSFSFDVVLKNMDFDVIDEGERVNVNVSDSSAPFDKTGIEAYNNDGMCLVFKGFIEDPSEYRDDIHALFIVENSAGKERYVNVDYDSLSINGFMTDFTCYSRTLLDANSQCLISKSPMNSILMISPILQSWNLSLKFEMRTTFKSANRQ